MLGGRGKDTVLGQSGDDVLFGDDAECFIVENPRLVLEDINAAIAFDLCTRTLPGGDDSLIGGMGQDFISGDVGSDRVVGGAGDDVLFGGQPNHESTQQTTQYVFGGDGSDTIRVDRGSAHIFGGNDNDVINTTGAPDTLTRIFGGAGNDSISHSGDFGNGELRGDHVDVFGGLGDDGAFIETDGSAAFFGGAGDDRLQGHEQRIGALRAFGGDGDDILGSGFRAIGDVLVDGGDGNDVVAPLALGATSLVVRGGDGDDLMFPGGLGGDGIDQMYISFGFFGHGGPGDDQIIFTRNSEIVSGNDGNDLIFYSGEPFADVPVANGGSGLDSCSTETGSGTINCESPFTEAPFDMGPLFGYLNDFYD